MQGIKAVVGSAAMWPVVAGTLASLAGNVQAHEATVGLEAYLARQAQTYVCQIAGNKPVTLLVPAKSARAVIAGGGHLGPCAVRGDRLALGNGHVTTYAQLTPQGTPWAIGFEFPATMLDNLPTLGNDGLNCFDVNGDGAIDIEGGHGEHEECAGGHQRALELPLKQRVAPFKWGLVNWNPHGHEPEHVYDKPHFDFHFYTQSYIERNMIRVGPCGLLVNCDDFAKGRKPVPAGYMHPDFLEVGAVESRMGNHLIDVTSHEWDPNHGEFTQTWLYGTYDGKVTFWEPMITRDYLLSKPFMCQAIKLPQRYLVGGYYPTEYCIRYRAERRDYTVSLEGFVARAPN